MTFNRQKSRFELRMPCGRLLWANGTGKGARRRLNSYNKPMHLGRCWKCGHLQGNPKAKLVAKLKIALDSESGLKLGMFMGTFEPNSANARRTAQELTPEAKA